MAKQFKALVGFDYPADAESLERAKRGQLAKVKWAHVSAGEVVDEPSPDILKSWLANGCVKEVK